MQHWRLANGRSIDLSSPRIMAILNATPDSFADGGKVDSIKAAIRFARECLASGASMIDIGGESTRPGSAPVAAEEQIRRTVPIIRELRRLAEFERVAISIDTTRAKVAAAALDAGADAVNDVSGLQDDRVAMIDLLKTTRAGYILMHRLRPPAVDQYSDRYATAPAYGDVVGEVRSFLTRSLSELAAAGIDPERIVVDPGLGFGKSPEQNLALIDRTGELLSLGRPVLSGLSRKSFVGRLGLGRDSSPAERLEPTLDFSVRHLRSGARLFRVHDVGAHARRLDSEWAAWTAESRTNPPPPEGI